MPDENEFFLAHGVSMIQLKIELRYIEYDPMGGFRVLVRVNDRDTGKPLDLSARLPAPSKVSIDCARVADHSVFFAKYLKRALMHWCDHELNELIRVNGKRVFETASFHPEGVP